MTRMFGATARAFLLCFLSVGSATAYELLPLDRFLRTEELRSLKISPAGDYLALTTGKNGAEFLRFLNLENGKLTANVRAPQGLVIADIHWVSNTRVIFTLFERSEADSDRAAAGELYAVDRDGRRQLRLSTYQPGRSISTGTILPVREASYASVEVVSLLDSDDGSILIWELPWRPVGTHFSYDPQARPWITRLNTYTGTQSRIEPVPLGGANVMVDSEVGPRFAVGRSAGTQIPVAWKSGPRAQWEVFELRGYREGSLQARRFTPDDRRVLFTAVPEGARFAALFELDPTSRTVKQLIDFPDADVGDLVVDATGQTIGVANATDESVYRWLLPDHWLAALHHSPPEAFAEKQVRVISRSADAHRIVVRATSKAGASEYVLFDPDTKRTDLLAHGWLPIDRFARPDEFGRIKISPDGEYLAITSRRFGGEVLSFVKIGEDKPIEIVLTSEGFLIEELMWASATRVIFTTAEHDLGRIRPRRNGEIFAVDRDGRDFAKIYGSKEEVGEKRAAVQIPHANDAAADIVSLLERDDRNILLARMPRRAHWLHRRYDPDGKPLLLRLDVRTGERDIFERAPLSSATIIVDHDDQPRFAIGVNETGNVSVAWKRTANDKWEAFELPGYREGTIKPRRFTPDNRRVLFTAVPEEASHSELFELDLADRSVKQLIAVPDADIVELVNDPASKETLGVIAYADKLTYRWLQPDHPVTATVQTMLRTFDGYEVRLVSQSANGERAIVFVQSDVAPGEYFLFDANARRADMIAPVRKWIDVRTMRPKESVSLKARDGLSLHGYLTRPAGAGPYPLVVLPHAGPHGVRDTWPFDAQVQLLANRGYAVLQVNYRGSSGYGIDFEMAGHREWGAKMQDDLTDATRWAVEQKIAVPERICIYGVGYGGYAALMGAVREPNLYRCAIGFAGIYDLELMLASEDTSQSKLGSAYFDAILGRDPADLRARSPVSSAASIKAPVLLIHGPEGLLTRDLQATKMRAMLEQAGKHVETLRPFSGNAGVHEEKALFEVYQTLLDFLDRHLLDFPSDAT